MKRIVGACLSQFDGDEDNYEMLIAYADGKEIGNVIYKDHALRMAKEMAREFWLDKVDDDLLSALKLLFRCGQKQGWQNAYEREMKIAEAAISVAEGK